MTHHCDSAAVCVEICTFLGSCRISGSERGLSSSSSIESAAEEADLRAIRSSGQLLLLDSVAHLLANVWRSIHCLLFVSRCRAPCQSCRAVNACGDDSRTKRKEQTGIFELLAAGRKD